jgi:hypothetical protein
MGVEFRVEEEGSSFHPYPSVCLMLMLRNRSIEGEMCKLRTMPREEGSVAVGNPLRSTDMRALAWQKPGPAWSGPLARFPLRDALGSVSLPSVAAILRSSHVRQPTVPPSSSRGDGVWQRRRDRLRCKSGVDG